MWTGDELVSIGLDVAADDSLSLRSWTVADDGQSWVAGGTTAIGGNAFTGSNDYRVVWTGTEVVVWDGARQGWAYDPVGQTWRTLPELVGPGGTATVASVPVGVDGSLFVVTQTLGPSPAAIGVLELTGDGWESRTSLAGQPFDATSSVTAAGDRVAVLGAGLAPQAVDLTTGAWASIDPDAARPGRVGPRRRVDR